MGGTRTHRRRRRTPWTLLGAFACLPAAALLTVPVAPARADITFVPGTMSTAAQNTASFAVPVPRGVEVRAITGVVTMPEVVEGGTITFRVNGAVRESVPSSLYQKVRIPVDPADVIADGTIGLTMTTEGPLQAGATCVPAGGVASMRKLELDYRGAEVAPTSVADFFPASSAGITVVIPEDAGPEMITAGLTAVAALAYRYDDVPVKLSLTVPPAETASASQRVVALVAGDEGDVTTAVSTTSGIPMLTLTGAGEALVDAARVLSTDVLGLSGSDPANLSQEVKPRNTAKTRTLDDLGIGTVALTGYGSVTQQFDLSQDSFGVPISSLDLHLEGSHTAFSDGSGARLDVRVNGDLVDSAVLAEEATFDVDVHVPSSKLRSVNDIELTLNAVAPDGSACTPPSIPPAEVDLDTAGSTATVTHGTGRTQGFQLFPQIFEGVLPVALRSAPGREASAAINAAALIALLQRAAGSPFEIQLMEPDAFLADDRSGLIVGALAADSESLDAPLKLSSTRLLDRDNEVVELESPDPYAALESIDRNDRLVLMLGSWAPDNKAAPGELARKVVDAVVNAGWENLNGDLVIADGANPSFVAASRSLAPHAEVKKEKSYITWFVLGIVALFLVLAIQVVIAVRRDRRLARLRDDEFYEDGPAYVEDDDQDDGQDHGQDHEEFEVDALGDVDDLEVIDNAAQREEPAADDGDADEDLDEFDEFDDGDEDEDELDDEDALDHEDELDDELEEDREEEPESEDELPLAYGFDDLDDTGEIPVVAGEEYEEYDEDEDEPGADEPTEDEPAESEPTEDEPAADEPTEDEPPADEPTEDEPPADEPTEDEPPADEPTEDEPPADEPTEDEPPADEPTEDEPPADEPTEDEPPADEPTEDEPPADEPTEDEPPADEPTEDQPAEDQPADDGNDVDVEAATDAEEAGGPTDDEDDQAGPESATGPVEEPLEEESAKDDETLRASEDPEPEPDPTPPPARRIERRRRPRK